MRTVTTTGQIDADGNLELKLAIGRSEAHRRVIVHVQPVEVSDEEWHQFVDEMYGAWQGEPFQRPPQGEYERREELP